MEHYRNPVNRRTLAYTIEKRILPMMSKGAKQYDLLVQAVSNIVDGLPISHYSESVLTDLSIICLIRR